MEKIYEWVKNLFFFYIYMTILMQLLPKSSFKKYVRFFCGLLFSVMLLSPVLDILMHPGYLMETISYESFLQQTKQLEYEINWEGNTYQKAYEEALMQGLLVYMDENTKLQSVTVQLDSDYVLEEVTLYVTLWDIGQSHAVGEQLQKKAAEYCKIKKEQVKVICREGDM